MRQILSSDVEGPQCTMFLQLEFAILLNSVLPLCLFFRRPHIYCDVALPRKLPPVHQPIDLVSLPMLGYLEQTVASIVIKALVALGQFKPKFPFIDAKRSAVLYVALFLKGQLKVSFLFSIVEHVLVLLMLSFPNTPSNVHTSTYTPDTM